MSITNLDALFKPSSIAVIGASVEPKSSGSIVMRNLLSGQFGGPVMPVSAHSESIFGVLTYKDVDSLPITPDLGVICSGSDSVPGCIEKLGERGTRAVALLGPGFSRLDPGIRQGLTDRVMESARRFGVRVLGPNCLGLIVPGAGLNASLAQTGAKAGRIAFVTQSDSLFTTVLDWAKSNDIGFSHFISLGDQLDADFASVMDYLGSDPATRSILLYVESIFDARRFMSAARASARNKPMLVLKPGEIVESRMPDGTCSVEALASQDELYDVAFRRAGLVRVDEIDALFDGARNLVRAQPLMGDNLAIVTNGRSVGLLAADTCIKAGASLACLSDETREALAKMARGSGEGENPTVLEYDAGGEDYAEAIKVLLKDRGVHAVLVVNVPFADVPVEDTARAVAEAAGRTKKNVLTSWLGTESSQKARKILGEAGVPTFDTPDQAVHAFLHMVNYRRNQQLLMQTPDSLPSDFFPDTTTAKEIIDKTIEEGREQLSESEAKDVLAAYGVPVVETRVAVSARESVVAAEELGYPVALKIRSPEIRQPYDVGGVALDLETPEQVWDAAVTMASRFHRRAPNAHIDGYVVQQMGRRIGAHELFVSASVDEIFGPVIRFGHGGLAMRTIRDSAVALPPLNMSLARELIDRTRISRLLTGTGAKDAPDVDDLCLTLIQVTQLIIDIPQVHEVEINPLFLDNKGALAVGARIRVAPTTLSGPNRLAIRPYPRELEECSVLRDGRQVLMRPIRPEDAQKHLDFINKLSAEDLRLRFFGVVRNFEFSDMPKFTQIDYDREMAFIAVVEEDGEKRTVGVNRASATPDNSSAEFAIIISSDMKGQGLGSMLMDKMIRYLRSRGVIWLEGQTLPENSAMVNLAKKFGFAVSTNLEEDVVDMKLKLN